MISNVNTDDVSRKRKAKGTKTKAKKSRNDKPTETHETTEADETTGPDENETTTPIETTTDDDVLEHRIQQICDSPQYIPTAAFSDCEETVIP